MNSFGFCYPNNIYTKYKEDFNKEDYFSFNLKYPQFSNLNNTYLPVNPSVLNNINSLIKEDVYSFNNGIKEDELEFNTNLNDEDKKFFKAFTDYNTTFSKNNILSITLYLMSVSNEEGLTYNQLNNYNYDLTTGDSLLLKDIFNKGVDYLSLVSDYINYKISLNPKLYYPDIDVNISENQAFYLTYDSIIFFFDEEQIAPEDQGIVKFKMNYNKFFPYINPRFTCIIPNFSALPQSRASLKANPKYFKK